MNALMMIRQFLTMFNKPVLFLYEMETMMVGDFEAIRRINGIDIEKEKDN